MIEQLMQYWRELEQRERQMLLLGGITIGLTLVYLLAIEPLQQYHAALETSVERKRERVAWMQAAAQELAKLQPASSASRNIDTGSLLTLVDSSARSSLLANSLKRVQQDGDAAVRVRFEAAGFDDLLLWIGNLEQQYGVRVDDITLERADAPGRVDASITLARGAE